MKKLLERNCMKIKFAFFEANKNNDKLFTYGPLIHNQQVLDLLRNKGVDVIKEIDGEEKEIYTRDTWKDEGCCI